MNVNRYLAAGSITDSDFIYVFLGQVILFVLIWLAGVYALYKLISHLFPTLNKYIRLLIAVIAGIILVSLLGMITQTFQT